MNKQFKASLLGGAVLFGAIACKEAPKEADGASGDATVVENVENAVDVVEGTGKELVTPGIGKPTLSVEERAAKLGFAKYLPKETELVVSAYNSQKAAEQLKALKLYGLLVSELDDGELIPEDEDPMIEDDLLEAEQGEEDDFAVESGVVEGPNPWMLLGQEVTIALGDTAVEETGRLLTLNRRMAYFQARVLGKAAQSYAKTGNLEEFSKALTDEMGGRLIKNLVEDADSGVGLFEKAEFPPIYISFRAKEGEMDQAAQLVNSGMAVFGMAGEMAAPVEVETGGGKFLGYKLLGSEVSKMLAGSRESLEANLNPESVDALLGALAKKNLVFVTGTVGDYVVMMMGGSEDSLKLATDPRDSLVATEQMGFADSFADKQLVSLIYGGKEVWDEISGEVGGLASYAIGLRDGITGGDGMGDTRDLEAMLELVADREKALLALGVSSDLGLVAYAEDGLKIESFGGYDKGAVDWDAETKLSHLRDSSDNVIFLNIPSNAAYDEKLGDYIEAIVETAYAATVKLADLEIDAPELAEIRQFTKLFDGQFREDIVGFYGALGGMSGGLGSEMALVMDLKGSMPALPGVPQEIVDEAKAPRITLLSPVVDRTKIQEAWKDMDIRATSLLAKVSEMTGKKIPMQKPISSEKDGMTTWFFSFPFFQDDFLPSVTVSDDWFALSTSKTQSLDLLGKAAVGGDAGSGVQLKVNFTGMAEYADEMLQIVDRNSAVVFTDEADLGNFNDSKSDIKKMIEACRQFDSMTWTVKGDGGRMHGQIHFKTK